MALRWHILPLDRRPRSVPQLLANYSFDVNVGYTICLTDLTRVWSETLGLQQIIRRSLEEDISIDPSEDDSQLKILLDKIQAAIQGAEGTSLEFLPHERDGLVMEVNAALPSPLAPLIWPIRLGLSAQELLTEKLVLPSLGYHLDLRDEIESLIGQVKSKDRIIGKFMDKMEMSGVDLGTIFPGISMGKKSGQLEMAQKVVRGLEPFKEETWRKEMRGRARETKSKKEVLDTIFGSNEIGPFAAIGREIIGADSASNWWENLDSRSKGGSAEAKKVSTSGGAEAQATESESSNEFQTQETPPHLKGPSKRQPRDVSIAAGSPPVMLLGPAAVDDTTDDDLNDPPPKTAPSRPDLTTKISHEPSRADFSSKESASDRKRVPQANAQRVIGRKKPNIKEQDVAEEHRSSSPTQHQSGSGSETTSGSSEKAVPAETRPVLKMRHIVRASPERRSLDSSSKVIATRRDKDSDNEDETSPEPSSSKPKGHLGVAAGGDRRVPNRDVNTAVSSSQAVATQSLKPKARFGVIGGKKRATTPDAKLPNEPSSPSVTAPPLEPRPSLDMIGKKKGMIPEDTTKISPTKSGRGGKLGFIGGRGGDREIAARRSREVDGNKEDGNPQITKWEGRSSPLPSPPARLVEAPPPPAPETEEEKANRRRDELKRQLDVRSKAPAKKKRKF
ncbi:hypothetical protein GP486_001248 [Trichoglossum hirsutum]|uniref:Non-homologous end-joining factor 1 n=1 Tax=Trichoglossum hirsutum TaxID=265104 RepID=A0A9P8RST8_9PEZI|nr:hypothetical protein GP486_001248 [Trichoglossum hirsutum]